VADDDSTKAVSQVEQMMASRCFRASEGKLGCISCHDPHDSISEANRVEHYRTKCLDCHADRGCTQPRELRREKSTEDSCVTCHMPRLGANDVPHTSQTDHRIVRRQGAQVKQPTRTIDLNIPRIFDTDTIDLPRHENERSRGLLLSLLAERQPSPPLAAEVERLLAPWSREHPDDLPVLDGLALAATLQQRPKEATAFWNTMLARSPDNETALNSLSLQGHCLRTAGQSFAARRPLPGGESVERAQAWAAIAFARRIRAHRGSNRCRPEGD